MSQEFKSVDNAASQIVGEYAAFKELTNEEISDIRDQFFAPHGCNIYTFARAILRKAQEK